MLCVAINVMGGTLDLKSSLSQRGLSAIKLGLRQDSRSGIILSRRQARNIAFHLISAIMRDTLYLWHLFLLFFVNTIYYWISND